MTVGRTGQEWIGLPGVSGYSGASGYVASQDALVVGAASTNRFDDGQTITRRLILDPETVGGDYWTAKCVLPVSLSGNLGFKLSGFGYSHAGRSTSNTSSLYCYNDNSDSWTAKSNFTYSIAYAGVFELNGFGYSAGGFRNPSSTSYVASYSPSTDTWTAKTPEILLRCSTGAFVLTGYGYCFDGLDPISQTNYNDRYDDASNTWTPRAPDLVSKSTLSALAMNSIGYSWSGYSPSLTLATSFTRFNDLQNSWVYRNTGAAFVVSTGQSTFTVCGLGYVCQGLSSSGTYYSSILQHNDVIDQWIGKYNNASAAYNRGAFSLNGFGYSLGGEVAGPIDTSYVSQYRNSNLYEFPWPFKRTDKRVRAILPSGKMDFYPKSASIQAHSDGSNLWINGESNSDSLLKTGQTISDVFPPVGATRVSDLRVRVGIPRYVPGYSGGVWMLKSPAPRVMGYNTTVSLNGYIYSGPLYDGFNYTSWFTRYDDGDNSWTYKYQHPYALYESGGISLNGYEYVIGGYTSTQVSYVSRYEDATDSWSAKLTLPVALTICGVFSLNGFGYNYGGYSATNSLYQFNDSANSWVAKLAGGTAKYGPVCNCIRGFAYASDGYTSAPTNENIQYNDAENTWAGSMGADLVGRYWTTGFSLGGLAYVCGGYTSTYVSYVTAYYEAARIWQYKYGMSSMYVHGSAMLNGYGYAVGGYNTAYVSFTQQYASSTPAEVGSITLKVLEE